MLRYACEQFRQRHAVQHMDVCVATRVAVVRPLPVLPCYSSLTAGLYSCGVFKNMFFCFFLLQIQFRCDGPLGSILAVADTKGQVKGRVGNPAADPPLRPDGKLNVGAAVGQGARGSSSSSSSSSKSCSMCSSPYQLCIRQSSHLQGNPPYVLVTPLHLATAWQMGE
jgi:hypothetical protein